MKKPTMREIERIEHPVAPNRTNNPLKTDQPRHRAPVLNAQKKDYRKKDSVPTFLEPDLNYIL